MNDILFLPVKPKWAELIMSGKKTLELRKRLPSSGRMQRCVVYSSSPKCEVAGTALFAYTCDLSDVRVYPEDRIVAESCVSVKKMRAYFGDSPRVGLRLRDPVKFAKPIPLETLRQVWGIEPPQQWRYISREVFDAIVRAGQ